MCNFRHDRWLRAFVLLLLPCLSACASVRSDIEADLASTPVYYMESKVERNPPDVHIYPVTDVGGIKVLFIPLKVVQPMDRPEMVGYSVSRAFWQSWSAMRVFERFEFAAEAGPFRRDTALALAKAKGADMVVGGFVTYIFAGGSSGENRIALQIEGYDVLSGLLVWSMAQGGVLPAPATRDYIAFAVKNKRVSDPLYAITATLAGDMGKIMRAWSNSENAAGE